MLLHALYCCWWAKRQRTGILRGAKDHRGHWSAIEALSALHENSTKRNACHKEGDYGCAMCLVADYPPRAVVGFVVDREGGTGAGFFRVLQHTLPIIVPSAPHSYIVRGWYNRPVSGRCTKWTQVLPHPKNSEKTRAVFQRPTSWRGATAVLPPDCTGLSTESLRSGTRRTLNRRRIISQL
jgi:hypothetical protein